MIKVGIVGTGVIAREHARAISMVPESAQLIATADVVPERQAAFADEYKVTRCYNGADGLIADPEVGLVVVATPPSAHDEAVIAALDAGKHVLCEKPLSHSLAAAERICEAEARHPGRLSVNYQLRYAAPYCRMLWLIKNGWIGVPQCATVERHGYIPQTAYGHGGWWGAWDIAGGGALITQMIHEVDIMLLAMGEPTSVEAQMDTRFTSIESEDWIEARVTFNEGRYARLAASVNCGQMRGGLTIIGSLGRISPDRLDLTDPELQSKAIAAADAALPHTRLPSQSLPARVARKLASALCDYEPAGLPPHALLYRKISRAMTVGAPMPIPAAEAMRSLRLVAGTYEAAVTGRLVALPIGPEAESYTGLTKMIYGRRPRPPAEKPTIAALPRSHTVRVGLIGLDTTHAPTFTDLLHNPYNGDHIPGAKVVAAFPGGSADMHISASRVGSFTAELRDRYGVPILNSPEEVADAADVVFILSADGRAHPGLFRSVAGRGKPVFIDKPLAISSADARNIFGLARETGTKLFASSAFRYADSLVAALKEIRASGEQIITCTVRYWGQIQPTQGRFFWYGIHGAEMLVAVMGGNVASVNARTEGVIDTINIKHSDGRTSSLVGHRNDGTFHVSITTDKRTVEVPAVGTISARLLAAVLDKLTPGGYPRIWRATAAGSVEGRAGRAIDPDEDETLAVIDILDAAQRSHALGTATTLEV